MFRAVESSRLRLLDSFNPPTLNSVEDMSQHSRRLRVDNSVNDDDDDHEELTRVEWAPPSRTQHSGPGQNAILALQAAAVAAQDFNESFAHIRNDDKETSVPLFLGDELVTGHEPLRHWGYFDEFELKAVRARSDLLDDGEFDEEHEALRDEIMKVSIQGHYSIKVLQSGLIDLDYGALAAEDFMTETRLLMNLGSHPHMAQIYGLNRGGIDTLLQPGCLGFFVMTDRIQETLPERLLAWKAKQGYRPPSAPGQTIRRFAQRLEVALDIASALKFLHEKKLVYHIRPDKVGFNIKDRSVKLFQFGQVRPDGAAQARSLAKAEDMTTIRYTAPEVLCGAPATTSSDVYSFGVVLWEIMSLKIPFGAWDRPTHMERCVQNHARPPMNRQWPSACHDLLQGAWHPHLRLTMRKVHARLLDLLTMEESGISTNTGKAATKVDQSSEHHRNKGNHKEEVENRRSTSTPSNTGDSVNSAEKEKRETLPEIKSDPRAKSEEKRPNAKSTLLHMLKQNGMSTNDDDEKEKESTVSQIKDDTTATYDNTTNAVEKKKSSSRLAPTSSHSPGSRNKESEEDRPSQPRASKPIRRVQRRTSVDVSCRPAADAPVALQFMTPQPTTRMMHRSASMSHIATSDNNVVALVLPTVPLNVESPKQSDFDDERQEEKEPGNERISGKFRGFIRKTLGRSMKRGDKNTLAEELMDSASSLDDRSVGHGVAENTPDASVGSLSKAQDQQVQLPIRKATDNESTSSETKRSANTSTIPSNSPRHNTPISAGSSLESHQVSKETFSPAAPTTDVNKETGSTSEPKSSTGEGVKSGDKGVRSRKKKSTRSNISDESNGHSRETISWSRVASRNPRRASMGRVSTRRYASDSIHAGVTENKESNEANDRSTSDNGAVTWHRSSHEASETNPDGDESVPASQSPTRRRRTVQASTSRRQGVTTDEESSTLLPENPPPQGRMRMRRRCSTGAVNMASLHRSGPEMHWISPPKTTPLRRPSNEEDIKDVAKRLSESSPVNSTGTTATTNSSAYDSDRIERLIDLEGKGTRKAESTKEPVTPRRSFGQFAQMFRKSKGNEGDLRMESPPHTPLSPSKLMSRFIKSDKLAATAEEPGKQKVQGSRNRRASIA